MKRLLIAVLLVAMLRALATDESDPPIPRPDEGAAAFAAVPDFTVTLADGRTRPLSELWRQRPLLLTLVFARCGGVCAPFVRALRGLTEEAGGAGARYDVLVLSFDPRDTPAEMEAVSRIAGAVAQPGWHFAVAAQDDVRALARVLGFRYLWNEATRQYDHPAVLAGIRDGRVVRLLTGGAVSPARFGEVLSELRGDFVPFYPAVADTRFRCFEFGADGVVRPSWGMMILVYPAVMALSLGAAVFLLARRGRPAAPNE